MKLDVVVWGWFHPSHPLPFAQLNSKQIKNTVAALLKECPIFQESSAAITAFYNIRLDRLIQKGCCTGKCIAVKLWMEGQPVDWLKDSVRWQLFEIFDTFLGQMEAATLQAKLKSQFPLNTQMEKIDDPSKNQQPLQRIFESGVHLVRLYHLKKQKAHAILCTPQGCFDSYAHKIYPIHAVQELLGYVHFFHSWALKRQSYWLIETF